MDQVDKTDIEKAGWTLEGLKPRTLLGHSIPLLRETERVRQLALAVEALAGETDSLAYDANASNALAYDANASNALASGAIASNALASDAVGSNVSFVL
jgi:hypothetical protein